MKRSVWKRFVSVGLIGIMTAGLLAGCGGGGDSQTGAGGDTQAAGGSGSSGGGGGVTLTAPGTYPIVEGGDLELSMLILSMPNVEDFATNDFSLFMEEKTGIKMEFVTGGRDDMTQKQTMLFAGGDYPDIIFGTGGDIAKYGVGEGIFIPLDDYLTEDIVPNYLKLMENYGLDMTREVDGKIYSLATMNECYHCNYGRKMWVNTYYLDQIGCEIPTTTEEFKDVCQKFLEFKPDGIAVMGCEKGWFSRMQDWIMGAYTLVPNASATLGSRDFVLADTSDGSVLCVATTDEYKEGLKFINELYEMGAIYDGSFSQTAEVGKTVINQPDEPVLFFTDGTISDMIDSESNNELYRHYAPMAPIEGPDGTRIAWSSASGGVSSGGVMITDTCENVEAALRWVDFFYSEFADLYSQYGSDEGTDWVLAPEGKVGLNDEPALYEVLNAWSSEPQNHDWQDVGIRVAPANYRLGQAVEEGVDPYATEGLEKLLYDASVELYAPYAGNTTLQNFIELKVSEQEKTDIGTIPTEIEKVIAERSTAFMMGTQDIDAEWDDYLAELEAAGLPQLLEFYQMAYDRSQGK